MALPTLHKCRRILGPSADSLTDEQVEKERDHLTKLASLLFDQFAEESRKNPDAMRYLLDAHRNGVTSDAHLNALEHGPDEWVEKPKPSKRVQ